VRSSIARFVVTVVVFLFLVPAVVLGGVSPASAATPPTLTGELFVDTAVTSETPVVYPGDCDADGTSSFSFTSTAVAIGPYPGTYVEQGTATVGPQQLPPVESDGTLPGIGTFQLNAGPLFQVSSTFEIDSTVGHVTGTKTLIAPQSSDLGGCLDFEDQFLSNFNTQGRGWFRYAHAIVQYDATIQTPDGSFHDSGTSLLQATEFAFATDGAGPTDPPPPGGMVRHRSFYESFTSSLPQTEALGPATVTLTPADAVNTVGTSHTVTATVRDANGAPVAASRVLFTVSGSSSATGSCITAADGQCSYTYSGPKLPGADLIAGCADANENGEADMAEPCGEATKAWILPVSTPGQVTGGGQILNSLGNDKIAFGFTAKNQSGGPKGTCTVVDPSGDTQVKCLDVTVLVQSATHAAFFGNAEVNGTPTVYRIDVDDFGEPGRGHDTFALQTATGYNVAGVLQNGNIQIHGT
jgi:hypothetical protein